MDRLEKFLDQVCRGLGGPVEMRRHVRQELREHLLDAVTQHKAAGDADEAALQKALDEFGQPAEVAAELEATHGRRMNWIIDKAMQWKERTMKAKWLWLSWAHGMLGAIIGLEVLLITFNVLFIIPKFQKLMVDGIIDPSIMEDEGVRWMVNFVLTLKDVTGHYTTWLVLGSAALWALFEWRVKSEHKTLIRLSALGTVAVALLAVIILMTASLVISFTLGAPAMGRISRPWVVEQVTTLDKSTKDLEQALAAKNWKAMAEPVETALGAAARLTVGPAASSLAASQDNGKIEAMRAHLQALRNYVVAVQNTLRDEDVSKTEAALSDFRKALEPVREAAKRPVR